MQRIYLDNNATTAVMPDVLAAMQPYWSEKFGNASSMHQEGRLARRAIETARETIAELLSATPDQVIFTSGGTEANHLAVLGLAGHGPTRLLTSTIEHPSVLGCLDLLARRGFEVHYAPVDCDGVVQLGSFSELLTPSTRFASVMLANNETGAIQPVEQLAQAARDQGIPFHTDAVQAVGRLPVSFRSLGVSALTLSAHKFHGPLGVGALVVEQRDLLQPAIGGGHQEGGFRPGTEPVALIVGMAKALEISVQRHDEMSQRVRQLRDYFENSLRNRLGIVSVNGPLQNRLANTSSVRFARVNAQSLVMALDLRGVACSAGSACASGAAAPSHALLAMGLSEDEARSSVRFSFSPLSTMTEIERAVDIVTEVARKIAGTATISGLG